MTNQPDSMGSPWAETRSRRALKIVRDGWTGLVVGSVVLPVLSGLVGLAALPTDRPKLSEQVSAFGLAFSIALAVVVVGAAVYAVMRAASLQRVEARAELQRRDSLDVRVELARQKPLRDETGEVCGYILQLAVTNQSSSGEFVGRAWWQASGERLGDPWFTPWAQTEGRERVRQIGLGDTEMLQVVHVLEAKGLTDSGWIMYPKLPGDVDTSDVLQRTVYRLRDDHKDPMGDANIVVRVRRVDTDGFTEIAIGFETDNGGRPVPYVLGSTRGPQPLTLG